MTRNESRVVRVLSGWDRLVFRVCRLEAERCERPIRYLPPPGTRKDELARKILQESPVSEGLVCVLTCTMLRLGGDPVVWQ